MSIAIVCTHTQKNVILVLKKITQFKFSSFQENILHKDNRYLLKEKR